jgi:hypothetical protein
MPATIELSRLRRGREILRAYHVIVDGQRIGRIRHGQTRRFQLPAGHHEIWLTIDWCRSPSFSLNLPEGGLIRLWCGPSHAAWRTLYDAFFDREKYLTIGRTNDDDQR